jgi:putative IMPACT (imprinted ancient) family translation regulator
MSEHSYQLIADLTGPFVYKDRNSVFYGYALPFESDDQLKKILETLKITYPKANHFVYAYRREPISHHEFYTDDGEPKNSAGPHVLGQLIHKNLYCSAVIVARVFGGTPLGIPGLINAYRTAAEGVLSAASISSYTPSDIACLSSPYNHQKWIETLIKKHQVTVLEVEYTDRINTRIAIPHSELEIFEMMLKDDKRYVDLIFFYE